jgi:peroxiredoxin
VENWLTERGITFPTIIDSNGTIYQQYQIIGQPTTFIIAADGIISHIFYGPVTEASLSEALVNKES